VKRHPKRKPNRLVLDLNDAQVAGLEIMRGTGFHGLSLENVVERIIDRELQSRSSYPYITTTPHMHTQRED
jgi:hypothetical protein